MTLTPQIPAPEPTAIYWQGSVEIAGQRISHSPEGETIAQGNDRADTGESIRQLRASSGLTWDQMARLFGVSRRAVHLWAAGGRMNSRNIEFLGVLERVVNNLPGSTPEERRALLFSQDGGGRSLYDSLRSFHTPRDDASSDSGYTFDQLIGALHDRK
ncbi:DNA-binding transcriptional regulator [Streptomyces sp. I4(2020)]|uniref:helix-turn-helix domain-containing protein n=1 Tax=Streptomyces sp. I4(2020) TaxID=2760981 RepID=UPI0018EE597B|nr:helix-turn-helix transcriptional regulator [Streptomyces sp. I4(2020)]MBJ6616164.1 helix-turn-helix transcriptional regulator [Streptomyces sp. I3(2020)]MBJ6626780.1 helix-turn-helix transcriptional regulator [Streptomyces sp. I4(2020)]